MPRWGIKDAKKTRTPSCKNATNPKYAAEHFHSLGSSSGPRFQRWQFKQDTMVPNYGGAKCRPYRSKRQASSPTGMSSDERNRLTTLVHSYRETAYMNGDVDPEIADHSRLKPANITVPSTIDETIKAYPKQVKAKNDALVKKLVGDVKQGQEDRLTPVLLNGRFHPRCLVHAVKNHQSMQPAIRQLGIEVRKQGYTNDDLPALWPRALYGDVQGQFIANTHGLRDEDVKAAKAAATKWVDDLISRDPKAQILLRTRYHNVVIGNEHPTVGKVFQPAKTPQGAKAPLGQVMHVQTQIVTEGSDGKQKTEFTIESTGAPNHPLGKDASTMAFSFNADHEPAPTNNLPVRYWSKDGKKDLYQLTPYMQSVQGQNTNFMYARRGDYVQQPHGLEYPTNVSTTVPLDRDQAIQALTFALLTEKGGQVVAKDNKVPNPNEKHKAAAPKVDELVSAGTTGQHAQATSQSSCVTADASLKFEVLGFNRLLADDDSHMVWTGATADTFNINFLETMNLPGAKAYGIDGKEIPPQKLTEFLGPRTHKAYQQAQQQSWDKNGPPAKDTHEKAQAAHIETLGPIAKEKGQAHLKKKQDAAVQKQDKPRSDTPARFFIGSPNTTVAFDVLPEDQLPIDNSPPTATDIETMDAYVNAGVRPARGRFDKKQQVKDYGLPVGSEKPLGPDMQKVATDLIAAARDTYDLPEDSHNKVIESLPFVPEWETNEDEIVEID
ncbi:MAG: hypothetical protein AAGD08_11600 [Pseudomonadota bacterium]